MKDKWAIIDDIRELNCDFIAKNGRDGLQMMTEHFDEIRVLCLDHDLGDVNEPTGFDVLSSLMLRWLVPEEVQLVTSNPVGRDRMANLLMDNGYQKSVNGLVFRRVNEAP